MSAELNLGVARTTERKFDAPACHPAAAFLRGSDIFELFGSWLLTLHPGHVMDPVLLHFLHALAYKGSQDGKLVSGLITLCSQQPSPVYEDHLCAPCFFLGPAKEASKCRCLDAP